MVTQRKVQTGISTLSPMEQLSSYDPKIVTGENYRLICDTIDKLLANDPKLKPLSLAFNSKLFMEKLHLAFTILQNVSATLEWFELNEQQAAHVKMHLTEFVNRLAEVLPEYFKNPCTGEREGFLDQAMAWAKGLQQAMTIK
jgi:hypothetical protein